MKTILIPTDFSDCAENALRFAAYMAQTTGANLNLIHILDVPHIGPQGSVEGTVDDPRYMMDLLKATKTRTKKLLKLPFMKDLSVTHNIEVGRVTDAILKAAEKYKADLIVMGTHGAKGLEEILVGSNAERVVRNSRIPVLTIKHDVLEPKIEKIVFATDFSEECDSAFEEVEKMAKQFNAKIEVVNVVTKHEFEPTKRTQRKISKFKKKFKGFEFSISPYYDLNKQQGIRRFAHEANADLIALATHGRHGLSHLFNGSIAEDLVNHSSLPVLAVNLNKRSINEIEIEEDKGKRPQRDSNERPKVKEPHLEESILMSQIPVI